jgi:predicted nucleic acid-binding protein
MNLHDIRNGSRVLVDANILLYASAQRSPECVSLVTRVAQGAVEGVITTVVLGELCHRWMMQECKDRGIALGGNPARALSEKRHVISQLTEYYSLTMALIHSKFSIRTVEPQDFVLALQLQKRWGLLTNDSLQLALAERSGLTELATADTAFDSVQGLIVYKPGDLNPPIQ